MSPGTLCREKSGLCDLPEYCTGQSPFCPSNSYQIDGTSCEGGKAYCYNGMCLTYKDQCLQLWGPGKDTTCSVLFWEHIILYSILLLFTLCMAVVPYMYILSDKAWGAFSPALLTWRREHKFPMLKPCQINDKGVVGTGWGGCQVPQESATWVSLMQEHGQHQTPALRKSMLLEMSTGTVGRTSMATTGSVRKGRKRGSWELLSGEDVFICYRIMGQ